MKSGSRFWMFFMYFVFIFTFGFLLAGAYYIGRFDTNFSLGKKDLELSDSMVSDSEGASEKNSQGSQVLSDLDMEIAKESTDSAFEQITETVEDPLVLEIKNSLIPIFVQKYDVPEESVIVGISKYDQEHAVGGVAFSPEAPGGWFLAAKSQGSWVVVQDGNGSIICQTIEPYNFPGYMVPECYDDIKNVNVSRTFPDQNISN